MISSFFDVFLELTWTASSWSPSLVSCTWSMVQCLPMQFAATISPIGTYASP